MIMTLASRLLGLVRLRIMSSLLGATASGDIFFFTFNLANNSRKLLAEGALSSAYIPTYSSLVARNTSEAGGFFLRTLYVLSVVTLIAGGLLYFTAEPLLGTISQLDQELIAQYGAVLLGIFTIYLLGIILTTLLAGTMQVHGRFFLPSLAPLIVSASVISVSMMWYPRFGILAIAWGFAVGAVIPVLMMLLRVLQFYSGGIEKPQKRISTHLMGNWGILLLLSSALFVSQQVSFYLASTLAEGSVMIFSNALMIWQLPFGVFFVSIASSLYPELSQLYAQRDADGARDRLSRAAGYVLALLIPSAALLWLFAHEVSQLILLSGRYDEASVAATASLLRYLSPALPAAGITQLFMRDLYIRSAWSSAVVRTLLLTAIDIICSILLIRTALGLSGLPAAYTLSTMVLAWISLIRFRPDRHSLLHWVQIVCSGLLAFGVMWILRRFITPWQGSWLSLTAYICVISAAGTVPLLLMYQRLGVYIFTGRRSQPSRSA